MNPQAPAPVNPGNPQQQVIERLKTSANVLVTVSNSPSVDQLAAAVGFTLVLNKMGKHATAVYSGDTPSTIEFLTPAATLEKNTDSLRDFIVSLDKSKADKLRYKVEDNAVKIFITPYRTSLSEKDLDFSQGDFNVDAVVALGVIEREQLDQAIIAHGRILHDATVITVSAGEKSSSLGAINWQDASASSLSEMLVSVGEALQPGLLDNQIATAYLTGIVAQTERFRNNKTTPKIMTMSAQLMAAGANQQLIASSLEQAVEVPIQPAATPQAAEKTSAADSPDGSLTVEHEESGKAAEVPDKEVLEEPAEPKEKHDLSQESGLNLDMEVEPEEEPEEEDKTSQIDIDEHGNLSPAEEKKQSAKTRHRLLEPLQSTSSDDDAPSFAGGPHPLTGMTSDDGENEPNSDPLSGKSAETPQPVQTMLDHDKTVDVSAPAMSEPLVPQPSPALPALPDISVPISQSTLPPIPAQPEDAAASAPVADLGQTSAATPLPDTAQTIPPFLDDNTLRDIEKTFDSAHIVQDPNSTINEIEEVEHSPHLAEVQIDSPAGGVDYARDAVTSAINTAPYDPIRPEPLQALNAAPIDTQAGVSTMTTDPVLAGLGLTDQASVPPLPTIGIAPTGPEPTQKAPSSTLPPSPQPDISNQSGQSPPPVPPPLMPLR